MLRSLVVCLVVALGVTTAAGARAEAYRLPKTGAPAFVVDAPAGWSATYDTDEHLQFLSADRSAFLQVSIITDPRVATTPVADVARQVFAAAKMPAYSRTQAGAIGGVSGQSFTTTTTNNGVTLDVTVTIVKLDATHDAWMSTIVRKTNTPAQMAVLQALVARVRIVGR